MGNLNNPKREKIIQATIECVEKYGGNKTTIEDIAKRAKVGRQTVYRLVGTRDEIIEEVLIRRLKALLPRTKKKLAGKKNLEDALVAGLLGGNRLYLSDPVIEDLLFHDKDMFYVSDYVKHSERLFEEVFFPSWYEVFERALENGELRSDVPIRQLIAWLRMTNHTLLFHHHLSAKDQEEFIREFVAAALLAPATAA